MKMAQKVVLCTRKNFKKFSTVTPIAERVEMF